MSLRVVIADDQGMVRAGLRSLLEGEPDIAVVGEAADGEEAIAAAKTHVSNVLTKLGCATASRRSSSPTTAAWSSPTPPPR